MQMIINRYNLILLVSMLFLLVPTNTFGADIRGPLPNAENGWQRYSYTSEFITYYANDDGEWYFDNTGNSYVSPWNVSGTGYKFNFTGTKLRLISSTWSTFSADVTVKIDGQVVDTISFEGPHVYPPLLMYEKTGLEDREHNVEFINNTVYHLPIHAIDIDSSGELKPYNAPITPTNLTSIPLNGSIQLNWDAVYDASEYHVKRSLTPGGPYTVIADHITEPRYTDINVVINTDYYYVVTAFDGDLESKPSTESSTILQTVPPIAPTNLNATAGDSNVSLNWDSLDHATLYSIKRSLVTGGPYETVSNVVYETTSFIDDAVINGMTYYYVVSAVNDGGESPNSNEVSATPQPNGLALLVIKLINGIEKEFELTMVQMNSFFDWYDAKDSGTGPSIYVLEKTYNSGPFTSRKEYILYNKILTFEVLEYEME